MSGEISGAALPPPGGGGGSGALTEGAGSLAELSALAGGEFSPEHALRVEASSAIAIAVKGEVYCCLFIALVSVSWGVALFPFFRCGGS